MSLITIVAENSLSVVSPLLTTDPAMSYINQMIDCPLLSRHPMCLSCVCLRNPVCLLYLQTADWPASPRCPVCLFSSYQLITRHRLHYVFLRTSAEWLMSPRSSVFVSQSQAISWLSCGSHCASPSRALVASYWSEFPGCLYIYSND
jgi:hypothetical protein